MGVDGPRALNEQKSVSSDGFFYSILSQLLGSLLLIVRSIAKAVSSPAPMRARVFCQWDLLNCRGGEHWLEYPFEKMRLAFLQRDDSCTLVPSDFFLLNSDLSELVNNWTI